MCSFVKYLNSIYSEQGFIGLINSVENLLTYGKVTNKGDGIYCITTAGYSDDEELCRNLISITSDFGRYHYIGYLRGGVFYFSEKKYDSNIEIKRITE